MTLPLKSTKSFNRILIIIVARESVLMFDSVKEKKNNNVSSIKTGDTHERYKKRMKSKPGVAQLNWSRSICSESSIHPSIHFIKMSAPIESAPTTNTTEDMSCKVFVGNLSYQTRESELKDIFSKTGSV